MIWNRHQNSFEKARGSKAGEVGYLLAFRINYVHRFIRGLSLVSLISSGVNFLRFLYSWDTMLASNLISVNHHVSWVYKHHKWAKSFRSMTFGFRGTDLKDDSPLLDFTNKGNTLFFTQDASWFTLPHFGQRDSLLARLNFSNQDLCSLFTFSFTMLEFIPPEFVSTPQFSKDINYMSVDSLFNGSR